MKFDESQVLDLIGITCI